MKNQKIDSFIDNLKAWKPEMAALRDIALSFDLVEDYKWMHPCYTLNGNNVFLIHSFKDYCALLFFKGAAMKDPDGILIQQTKNVQEGRQLRFTSLSQIQGMEAVIKTYILEAINIEKTGLKLPKKTPADSVIPEEFQNELAIRPDLKKSFEALTPGRQRAYLYFFAQPKQSQTRKNRIEKALPRILHGKGLDD